MRIECPYFSNESGSHNCQTFGAIGGEVLESNGAGPEHWVCPVGERGKLCHPECLSKNAEYLEFLGNDGKWHAALPSHEIVMDRDLWP